MFISWSSTCVYHVYDVPWMHPQLDFALNVLIVINGNSWVCVHCMWYVTRSTRTARSRRWFLTLRKRNCAIFKPLNSSSKVCQIGLVSFWSAGAILGTVQAPKGKQNQVKGKAWEFWHSIQPSLTEWSFTSLHSTGSLPWQPVSIPWIMHKKIDFKLHQFH